MNSNYHKFFELREKYPNLINLISELYAAYFRNNDSFPNKFYIPGNFHHDDISKVLSEFGISCIQNNTFTIRDSVCTFIVITLS